MEGLSDESPWRRQISKSSGDAHQPDSTDVPYYSNSPRVIGKPHQQEKIGKYYGVDSQERLSQRKSKEPKERKLKRKKEKKKKWSVDPYLLVGRGKTDITEW